MKTIILGRTGNQPFKIDDDADGVSRQHAQITITDNNEWYLEDLGSANGTYIREQNTGEMIPVNGKRRIFPMTFIFLGPDNSKGCCFFAKQADSYGDFVEDYQYLQAKEDEYDLKKKELDNNIKRMKLLGPVIVLLAVFGITGIPLINNALGDYAIQIRIFLSSLSGVLTIFYDGQGRKDQLKSERERWHHCPNPCCSNKLTSKEIRNMKCSKCKK